MNWMELRVIPVKLPPTVVAIVPEMNDLSPVVQVPLVVPWLVKKDGIATQSEVRNAQCEVALR
jgi:hypothetical protein